MKVFLGEIVHCEFDKTSTGNSAADGKCLAMDASGIAIRLSGGTVIFIQLSRISYLSMTQS